MREHRQQGVNRRTLVTAALAATPFLAARTASAGTKISQPAVHYQTGPQNGQECDACAHVAAPGACKLVDGDISPKGWCRLWTKKAA
jgi:predicted transglutaminase-like cysteine proteinase